ncbi:MAG: S23 ribosomal protein family protein [Parcubacteria group bacterium GW2011_GWA2_38_13]|nr:MAG: S23 ribosomal protein family protein [Parcubacteria group bacterium GW2011_GWA2_38_13]
MPTENTIYSYRDLIVWQRAMELVVEVYGLTKLFPNSELYGMTSQMRRSAVSIPCNIAEGRRRGTRKDYKQFLIIAYGSGAELETQIEIAKRLNLTQNYDYKKIDSYILEVMKMLNSMINKLNENNYSTS